MIKKEKENDKCIIIHVYSLDCSIESQKTIKLIEKNLKLVLRFFHICLNMHTYILYTHTYKFTTTVVHTHTHTHSQMTRRVNSSNKDGSDSDWLG